VFSRRIITCRCPREPPPDLNVFKTKVATRAAVGSGKEAESAFEISVQNLGDGRCVASDFDKIKEVFGLAGEKPNRKTQFDTLEKAFQDGSAVEELVFEEDKSEDVGDEGPQDEEGEEQDSHGQGSDLDLLEMEAQGTGEENNSQVDAHDENGSLSDKNESKQSDQGEPDPKSVEDNINKEVQEIQNEAVLKDTMTQEDDGKGDEKPKEQLEAEQKAEENAKQQKAEDEAKQQKAEEEAKMKEIDAHYQSAKVKDYSYWLVKTKEVQPPKAALYGLVRRAFIQEARDEKHGNGESAVYELKKIQVGT